MKKLTLLVAFTMLLQMSFAGGLLTNYNQSAQYVRMLSRNAALEIDAVFYNPAGLVKMEDGWHFAFYSQTIFQNREVNSEFPLLNDGYYEGVTEIPVFPDLYGVYKKGKWAFSLGIGPVGGGGTSTFDRGLPSFEIPISKAAVALGGLGVTGYNAELSFDGSSTFWGIQLGATYAINDVISVYGGARITPSKNTYVGQIKNVEFEVGGNFVSGPGLLYQAGGMAQAAADMPQTLQPIVDGGGGAYTLTQLEGAGFISATQKGQIEAGLGLMGLPSESIDMMDMNTIQGAYTQASPTFQAQADQLMTNGAKLEDINVNTDQTGTGVTPIIGLNISPNDDWNIGFKYEHKTYLTLKNKPKEDDNYSDQLFGDEISSDIPGIITAGVGYRGLDWLEVQLSYNMYLDKGVDYGYNVRYKTAGEKVHRDIDKNYYELGLGLQFNLSERFAISVGALTSQNGVTPEYQSDFSFTNSSKTLAGGFMWKITDKLTFDFGVLNTFYKDDTVVFTDKDIPEGKYNEKYGKTTLDFAAGLSYSIF